jgi:hypothetical protein
VVLVGEDGPPEMRHLLDDLHRDELGEDGGREQPG